MADDDGNDLSAYERKRLENIRKNAEFLATLGLQSVQERKQEFEKVKTEKAQKAKEIKEENKRKREQEQVVSDEPARRSSRLSGVSAVNYNEDALMKTEAALVKRSKPKREISESLAAIDDEEQGSGKVRYSSMPFDSDQLDDAEFQVYAALRKWRLLKARELDIETYKICQNRTLAELIRRKRNDLSWASLGEDGDSTQLSEDLVQCWGIGAHRASEGESGYNLIMELNNSEKLMNLLRKSRGEIKDEPEKEEEAENAEDK